MANLAKKQGIQELPEGVRLLEDTKTHMNRLEIRSSSSNNLYIISQTKKNGIWACSCPGFLRHRRCKHLDTVLPALQSVVKAKELKA